VPGEGAGDGEVADPLWGAVELSGCPSWVAMLVKFGEVCRSYVVTDEELRRLVVQREVEPLRVEGFLAGEIVDRYEPLKSNRWRYGQ